MDDLLRIVIVALRWRVFFAIGAAVGLAIFGVRVVPWFSGVQGIALAVAGFFAGLAWEAHAHGEPIVAASSSRKTSPSLAALAFAVGGSVWGLLSCTSVGAAVLGAAFAIAGLAAWSWATVVRGRTLQLASAVLYSASLLAGYAVPIAYVMLLG